MKKLLTALVLGALLTIPSILRAEEVEIRLSVVLEMDVYGDVNSICVYSITGQLIYTSHSNQIDIQGLPSGIYTTLINTNNGQISRKILKN